MSPSDRGLALVGYRGTGKTTVGRIVAGRAGRPFLDADRAFEERFGSIRRFFDERGEAAFRDAEALVLGELSHTAGAVLSTGGGVVLRAANRERLKDFGMVVWLSADPQTLAGRLRADSAGRPALTAAGTLDEIAEVLAARVPLYREVADAVVDTAGLTPEQVAAAVLRLWPEPPGGASS